MTKTITTLILLAAGVAVEGAEKPNIIFILADDMGYGDCTVNNPESKIPTPNIDRLARQGLRFLDAHSAASTCTGSRYGLLTGTCPVRNGVTNLTAGMGPVIGTDEVTIADLLKSQGYTTRMVGKWHLGFELVGEGRKKEFDFSKPLRGGPLDCGFDTYFGVRKAVSGPPYFYIRDGGPVAEPTASTAGTRKDLKQNGRDTRTAYPPGAIAPEFEPERCNAEFSNEVVAILEGHAKSTEREPLFLYYAMLQPHTPWLPTEEFVGRSKAGAYGDYVVQLDHEVGRLLSTLETTGLAKDTIVVFSSDNGALWRPNDIERFGHRANGIFSGTKGTPWEGGHRVPLILRWPGRVRAGQVTKALINHTDVFATLAKLFEVDRARLYPRSAPDSHSFLPVLENPERDHRRPDMVVTPGSYRSGDWKLRFARGRRSSVENGIEDAVLHDLGEDPSEEHDLSKEHPETKSRLFEAYRRFAAQVVATKRFKTEGVGTRRSAGRGSGRTTVRIGALPEGLKLNGVQREQVEALSKDYKARLGRLRRQLTELLTEEQQRTRDAAKKKAVEEGKGGVALRRVIEAAVELTEDQRQREEEIRRSIVKLTDETSAKLLEVLTEQQKASLDR